MYIPLSDACICFPHSCFREREGEMPQPSLSRLGTEAMSSERKW